MTVQPFARGQEKPYQTGPYLGGYVFVLTAGVAAGGTLAINHNLRVLPRTCAIVSTPTNEYPSRVAFSARTPQTATVKFESAQSAGAVVFLC